MSVPDTFNLSRLECGLLESHQRGCWGHAGASPSRSSKEGDGVELARITPPLCSLPLVLVRGLDCWRDWWHVFSYMPPCCSNASSTRPIACTTCRKPNRYVKAHDVGGIADVCEDRLRMHRFGYSHPKGKGTAWVVWEAGKWCLVEVTK